MVAAGMSLGGCVQLLLELQFLEAALPAYAPQPAVDELLGQATDMIIEVLQVWQLADPQKLKASQHSMSWLAPA